MKINLSKIKTAPIKNITELRIGDVIVDKLYDKPTPMLVVAIFADAGTLGIMPEDGTGSIYADFPDNPGDVFEYELDKIYKVTNYNECFENKI